MAVGVICSGATGMKWLDLLELEFDKAYVDLDLILGDIDEKQRDLMVACRKKMVALSAAFSQLTHKAHVVFATNRKLEKEMETVHQQLVEAEASKTVLQKELQLLQLHSAQLKVSAQSGHAEDSESIKQKLDNEMEQYRSSVYKETLHKTQLNHLRQANEQLRQLTVALESEVFGCRLYAKYLEKAEAGRILQIQLLGKDLKNADHDRLRYQIDTEIYLHAHKMLIRACMGSKGETCALQFPPGHDYKMPRKKQGVGTHRYVTVVKGENERLGISLLGGKEHGVPIVIFEILPHSPAWRSGMLYVGDAILSVNGIDLCSMKHNDAVRTITAQKGEITLEVVFAAPDKEWNSDSEDGKFQFSYQFFDCHTTRQLCDMMNKRTRDCATDPIDFETLSSDSNFIPQNESNTSDVNLNMCNTAESVCKGNDSDVYDSKEDVTTTELKSDSPINVDNIKFLNTIIPDRKALNTLWETVTEKMFSSDENIKLENQA